ncbi:MAG: hypothetical protein WA323_09225 [Candidatus Nitrosopolaris sp.]|jgi:hypothetical protein
MYNDNQIFKKEFDFNKIGGYDDIKEIVRRASESEDNYNLLFTGTPASSKTLFLLGITERERKEVYFDGSNTTNRILDGVKSYWFYFVIFYDRPLLSSQ